MSIIRHWRKVDSRTQSQKVARAIAFGIALLITISLFLLFIVVIWAEFKAVFEGGALRQWFYLAAAALVLFGLAVSVKAIHATWLRRETESVIEGPIERRGSATYGTLRDDDFERQLNWLREHKQLVKVIEGLLIAVLALIALLFGIS